ncbi:Na(+) H(+) antiporter subunit B, partial [hydrothermal vent metagenome]
MHGCTCRSLASMPARQGLPHERRECFGYLHIPVCHFASAWGANVMSLLSSAFDVLLGFGLLWLAWQALASPDLFRAIVLFIAFGLLMALAWVRLDAPDIALAEAAIGTGLTGALLLAALTRLDAKSDAESTH